MLKVMHTVVPTQAEWLLFLPMDGSVEQLFQHMYIPLDCEFLVAQWQQDGTAQMLEVYHIKKGAPLEINNVADWSIQQGLTWRTAGFYNRRKNLQGLILQVVVSEMDLPTTLKKDDYGNTVRVSGFLGETWKTLQDLLNFTYQSRTLANYRSQYKETTEEDWAIKAENGKWFGMIGILAKREADAAIGGLTMYPSRLEIVDFLIPLMIDNTDLYIREPDNLQLHWRSYLAPFRPKLWLAVFTAIILLTCALTLCQQEGRTYNNRSCPRKLFESLYYVYGAFCGQGRETTPREWPCRVVYLTSYILGFVLVAAYSAALISFLTVQRDELPFTSFEGLLKDGSYELGVTKGPEISYLRESNDIVMKKLYRKFIDRKLHNQHDNALEGFLRLCEEDKYALVTSGMWLRRLQNNDVPCNIQKVPHTTIHGSVSMALSRRSPYRYLLNHNLRHMMLSGVLQRLRERYWNNDLPRIARRDFGVSFSAVAPIFTILVSGIVFSILVLFLECGLCILKHTLGEKQRTL